mgnify:CR=1 FL=1
MGEGTFIGRDVSEYERCAFGNPDRSIPDSRIDSCDDRGMLRYLVHPARAVKRREFPIPFAGKYTTRGRGGVFPSDAGGEFS